MFVFTAMNFSFCDVPESSWKVVELTLGVRL